MKTKIKFQKLLRSLLAIFLYFTILPVYATDPFIDFHQGDLLLNKDGEVRVFVEPTAPRGVMIAARNLCEDIRKVCGANAMITPDKNEAVIIIATKEDGHWEQYHICSNTRRVSITGSDRRGTIYGIYELSRQIGVSPWYWWADAPIAKHPYIYVKAGDYTDGEPAVKYRGIFINDESPSFTGWCHNMFGGVNSKMYKHMFELLLRLKANYLWPAMWSNAFNEDDPECPKIADEMGIVMGTSHHEPMMRAHKEYTKRRKRIGPWDYVVNRKNIDKFFTEGLERNKHYDQVVTIGMRGDGDSPMGKGNDDENIRTLQTVIEGQRQIISDVYEKPASQVPQLWAIFTEVQRYYDRGLTVPDDVIKLFCDNNWGYIRRTGPAAEQGKPMGLYYHIDMNGGPWNDRWVNNQPVAKLREQLNLAYSTGLDDLWIINVGDLKPKELAIDFIMNYAWNPRAIGPDDVQPYLQHWATSIFGARHAEAIADIVAKYTKYNNMRHAETQSAEIFSVVNHREADRQIARWDALVAEADSVKGLLPAEAQDAYYELVYYPAVASAGCAQIYLYASKNHLYFQQKRPEANDMADKVAVLYQRDKLMENFYNTHLAGGKWQGMMKDRHFGYTHWAMPKKDSIPTTYRVTLADQPTLGVAVEGCADIHDLKLPIFDCLDKQEYYIDVFNSGAGQLPYKLSAKDKWVRLRDENGRVIVSINWDRIKDGSHESQVTISAGKQSKTVNIKAVKMPLPDCSEPFYGSLIGGEFSIPAAGYQKNIPSTTASWRLIPDLGRDKGDMGVWPVTAPSAQGKQAPCLEYNVYLPESGDVQFLIGVIPTQDINPKRGLRIAIALDDDTPVVLDARQGMLDTFNEYSPKNLAKSLVLKPLPRANRKFGIIAGNGFCRNGLYDAVRWLDSKLRIQQPGMHRLRVYMVDPEVVLERIIVNPDNNHPSYMGKPEILHN